MKAIRNEILRRAEQAVFWEAERKPILERMQLVEVDPLKDAQLKASLKGIEGIIGKSGRF